VEPGAKADAVLAVLRDALEDETLGPADDFYLAGGHSLLILRIVRRLADEFGIELDPRQFAVNSQFASLIAAARPLPTAGER
jgi:acyl carrier protein